MSVKRPKFLDSEWFVEEPFNWHLKDGAPEELVREFEAYMKEQEATLIFDDDDE